CLGRIGDGPHPTVISGGHELLFECGRELNLGRFLNREYPRAQVSFGWLSSPVRVLSCWNALLRERRSKARRDLYLQACLPSDDGALGRFGKKRSVHSNPSTNGL